VLELGNFQLPTLNTIYSKAWPLFLLRACHHVLTIYVYFAFIADLPQNEQEMIYRRKEKTPLLRWKPAQLSFFIYVKDKSGSYSHEIQVQKAQAEWQLDSSMHRSLLASHKTTHLKPGLG